ncbi:secreted protein [Melampsora americana]|nr:secreted protein [Melampsora americana]
MKFHISFVLLTCVLNQQVYGSFLEAFEVPSISNNLKVVNQGVEDITANIKPAPGVQQLQDQRELVQQLERKTKDFVFSPPPSNVQLGPVSEIENVNRKMLKIPKPITSVAAPVTAPEVAPQTVTQATGSTWIPGRRVRGCSRKPPQGEVPSSVSGKLSWFFNGGMNGC